MSDPSLIRQKLEQATAILVEKDVDLWLVYARETTLVPDPSLDLILGATVTWPSAFLISRDGRHTAIVGHYEADVVRSIGGYAEVVGYHEGVSRPLLAALDGYQPRQIALNYSLRDVSADGLTVGNYRTLLEYLDGTAHAERLISAEGIVAALRGRKIPEEVARIRRAIATTEDLFREVQAMVRPGMTQRQIAGFVQKRIDDMGLDYAWPKAHNPIVTCGPESAVGHAQPGDIALERGHLLHMDLGVKQEGYCSDLQRIWYVLDEGEMAAPPEVQQAFQTVRRAIEAGENALRPGVPGWQVDAAARQVVVEAGYPEYMHALGHLLGQTAHDGATVLGPRWERYRGICDLAVEVGNVFTLELHVTVPERGLVSLEEDVLVTGDGVTALSRPQTSLALIRP